MATQHASQINGGGYESDVEYEDEDVHSDDDDEPLVTPSGLDEPSSFANQQEQYVSSGHTSCEELEKSRVSTPNAALYPRIVSLVPFLAFSLFFSDSFPQRSTSPRPASSQRELGYISSNSSDDEDPDVLRKKLLEVPIRVYVQIDVITSGEDSAN